MRSRTVDGYGAAYAKSHNGYWYFPREHYALVRDAWTRGLAFVTIPELYDGPGEQVIKLGDISAIEDCTPDSVRAYQERETAEKKQADLGL